jgi:hypothetical protein
MDWGKFKSTIDTQINLKISLKSIIDIDDAVNHLTKTIQDTAWSSSSPLPLKDHTRNLPLHIRALISEKSQIAPLGKEQNIPPINVNLTI